jgi:hypothetical protein
MMDDLQKEPAPAEQGEGLTKLIIQIVEYVKWAFAPSMSKKDATEFWNKLEAILASRPQPEAAKDVRELDYGWQAEFRRVYSIPDNRALSNRDTDLADACKLGWKLAHLASARDQGEADDKAELGKLISNLAEVAKRAEQAEADAEAARRDRRVAWDDAIKDERKGEEMRAAIDEWGCAHDHPTLLDEIGALIDLGVIPIKPRAVLANPAEGATREGEPCLVCHHVEIDYKPVCRHCGTTRYISALAHEATGGMA